MLRTSVACFGIVFSMLLLPRAGADELRPALLELREVKPGTYSVLWKTPLHQGAATEIRPELPEACELIGVRRDFLTASFSVSSWHSECSGELAGATIRIGGLREVPTDVLVRLERLDGSRQVARLSALSPSFTIEAASGLAGVALTYFNYGVTHILAGYDHLLFVLALILLVATGRQVVIAVTAFTLAHSVTLAIATLGLLRPAQTPIEAVIALSILFLAVEIARQHRGHDSLTVRKPWLIAFAFGLLHGFGFAAALLDAGLPQNDIPAALLFFNVGVEIGQIAFIGAVLLTIALLRRTWVYQPSWLRQVPQYAIGVLAAFWTIERVAGFWS